MRLLILAMSILAANLTAGRLSPEGGLTLCDPQHFGHCHCSPDSKDVDCKGLGLEAFLQGAFPKSTVKLDLSRNNLTEIPEDLFADLSELEELLLADNKIEKIHPKAFRSNHQLKRLSLQSCGLVNVPTECLSPLKSLTSLQLDQNEIWQIDDESFENLTHLRNLRLEGNRLRSIPGGALQPLRSLEALNLGNNMLTSVPVGAFPELQNLFILLLKRNQITKIEDDAFANLTSLRVLELDNNLLTHLPIALTELTSLQELSISSNKIKYIPGGILQKSPGLALIELQGNPLVGVDPHAFSFLPKLRKLTLSEARELTEFPSLNGTSSLEVLRLDRASLHNVPATLCRTCPRLKSLDIKWNKLTQIPNLNHCKDLRVLDLAHNRITALDGRLFRGLSQLHDLLISHNLISRIPHDAFYGLIKLQVLDLEGNVIEYIHPEAFVAFKQLEDLNLGNNIFPILPANGLDRLLHLKTFNNPNLRDFPQPDSFPRIQTLVLSYAYHCCAFLPLIPLETPKPPLHESVLFPTDTEFDMSLWNSSLTDIWPQLQNLSKKFGTEINELWDNFGSDFTYPGNLPAYVEEYFEEQESRLALNEHLTGKIQCLPLPGPFLPCQDLFDWWTLRCGVWIVFLLAMLGNGTVVFVLVFSRSKMDVPRFLVCNLAAADFFMGIYLGLLAVVDASTLGEFRMYAIPWQMSFGCQLAGFLGVLSSELSVYTLAVITLERNYAITHAMHLNKRLSLKHAGYIMACGWSFALIMSLLPLFGISDYRKFAICLPFETETPGSLTYVVFLMVINGVAFLILMGCYLKMYCAIRGSQAWNSNDSRIAKRMALLVFTDFLCWSPIAFFSLTAAFGVQLVSLEQAKVFTVFVLPLNSCCNPFLYAILTKQFKKDCVLICKAIEESRVTRGIGRCRHSSNFSNRQTPANTNSLVDRSSKDNQHPHQQQCTCNVKLLADSSSGATRRASSTSAGTSRLWFTNKIEWLMLCLNRGSDTRRRTRSDQYAYQIAEIQQKTHKRASSVSSSENFSSSRSDSWRQNHHHHCGIPLRLLDPKRRASSWLVTRKTSQDSNLSSSRNDSSGSATTQSTSTWRMSRSSASSDMRTQIIPNPDPSSNKTKPKPRLTRQTAITDDSDFHVPPGSPARLTVRFLTTIPSAAETSMQNEDEAAQEAPQEDQPPKDSPRADLATCTLFRVPGSLHEGGGGLPTIRSAPSLSTPEVLSSPLASPDRNLPRKNHDTQGYDKMQSYKENSHLPYPSHCKSPYSRQNTTNQDPTIKKIVTKSRTSENNYGRSLMPIKPLAPKNSFFNSNSPSTSFANRSSPDFIDDFHEISNSHSNRTDYVGHFRPRKTSNRTSLNAFAHPEGKMSTVEVSENPKTTTATHTKSFQVKPRQNQLRLFTGSVENLMYWSKLRTRLHILFEVTATVVSIQASLRDTEKCFWISDSQSGAKLQVVFYEIDRPLQKLSVSSVVTCIGRLMTRSRMQAYKVVESSEEQKSDLERLSFICNRVADEIGATQKN